MLADIVNVTVGLPGWSVTGLSVHERLNEPFIAAVDIGSTATDLDPSRLAGHPIEIEVRRGEIAQRVLGIVTSVRERHDRRWRSTARLTVEPAFAALRHRTNTRIYQQKSVPEILAQVLGEGLAAFGREAVQHLARTYPPREYTVQYHETDFAFARRLMEEEGIVYFFAHEGGAEVMMLVDCNAGLPALEGSSGPTLIYDERVEMLEPDRVSAFEPVTRVVGTRVTARDFDWTHPSLPVEAAAGSAHEGPDLESYLHDVPVTYHGYSQSYAGNDLADQARLIRELQARDERTLEGVSSAIALRAGLRFELTGHPRVELDASYLVIESEQRFFDHARRAGDERGAQHVRFVCVPVQTPWRPTRTHPRPRISSIQTATVVGPAGEEIHTDEHGRVKVQFHWDRLGQRDDRSSCWIRVAQAMGGAGWGFSFIPRIGMEVIVSFVEGDPDRPIVTGVVYNTENLPAVDYPAAKTRTTIKTNSSPGGGGFNELRLEDAAGREEVYLQAQKDWNTLVKNDHTRRVASNERQQVGVDRTRKVGSNELIEVGVDETRVVGANRTRKVGTNESITIGHDRTKHVGATEDITIGKDQNVKVAKDQHIHVGGSLNESVSHAVMQTVTLAYVQNVGLSHTVNVGAMAMMNVVGNYSTTVGFKMSTHVGHDASWKVGGDLSIKARKNMSTAVATNHTVKVGLIDSLTVGAAQMINVGAAQSIAVGAEASMKVVGDYTIEVGGKFTLKCGDAILSIENNEISISSPAAVVVASTDGGLELFGQRGVDVTALEGDATITGGPFVKINCE